MWIDGLMQLKKEMKIEKINNVNYPECFLPNIILVNIYHHINQQHAKEEKM